MTITYQLHNDEGELCSIRRKVDGVIKSSIPIDSANTQYQEYLEWVAAGNIAEAAD
tara:strand:+ start:1173 stop:1340 length:168 start_codon:yes stop_codon:yes gene_type:complete